MMQVGIRRSARRSCCLCRFHQPLRWGLRPRGGHRHLRRPIWPPSPGDTMGQLCPEGPFTSDQLMACSLPRSRILRRSLRRPLRRRPRSGSGTGHVGAAWPAAGRRRGHWSPSLMSTRSRAECGGGSRNDGRTRSGPRPTVRCVARPCASARVLDRHWSAPSCAALWWSVRPTMCSPTGQTRRFGSSEASPTCPTSCSNAGGVIQIHAERASSEPRPARHSTRRDRKTDDPFLEAAEDTTFLPWSWPKRWPRAGLARRHHPGLNGLVRSRTRRLRRNTIARRRRCDERTRHCRKLRRPAPPPETTAGRIGWTARLTN